MNTFKAFLAVIFLTLSYTAYPQQTSIEFDSFSKSFIRKFNFPSKMIDSCINSSVLLKINVNNFKVSSIFFSDNAYPSIQTELQKIKPDLDITLLETYAKNTSKKTVQLLIPVFLINQRPECEGKNIDDSDKSRFTTFQGERSSEASMLLDPIVIVNSVLTKN